MAIAPFPPNQKERLQALQRYQILDSLPEPQYQDLTLLTAQICDAPISLISLIDDERQWFKARVGLEVEQTPLDVSFCAHAILSEGVLEVPDTTLDDRFYNNPFVTDEPKIRFYAGARLVTPDNFALGTLCVVDRVPRHLSPSQLKALQALARQVVALLELRRHISELESANWARAAALQELEANAAILRQFVEHAPAALAMLDEKWRYVAVSHRFLESNDLNETIYGQSHFQVCAHWPQKWGAAFEAALNGTPQRCECDELRQNDGSLHFVAWEILPWKRANGETGGVILLVEDISERVRAQKLKNDFVSVVSHELRTPLTSIRGALGLLEGGVAGELSPRAAQMIGIAHKNAGRLVVLINDILDIERIEHDKMRFVMNEIPVGEWLQNALDANAAYGEAMGVKMKLELPLPVRFALLWGDEARLMQVLANLLSNAAKFTPAGATVILRAALREKTLRVEVADQGPGVPLEFEPHLFERFSQADASSTRPRGGAGLGLAIARTIVEKHGGTLGYLAPPNGEVGAIFWMELPLSA